jgi:hypothetical protein
MQLLICTSHLDLEIGAKILPLKRNLLSEPALESVRCLISSGELGA